ncbi:response regulator transcription factor [Mesobacillus zeae]|uniref:Response regulator n=1 Tax=Mesobacillus zeae TaxID=1917180 RepID=A0A398B2T1_9BACI|nr:response regulator [Mesobacillus zeae]RID82260.1 response regulator [Mesobacillus zeae]
MGEIFISKKILVAEDEAVMRRLLNMYLTRESFIVEEAPNGSIALEKALSEDFDMILLDILMPEKNGLDVLQELRTVKDTPVILLSALGGEEDQQEGIKLGANGYVIKPFSPAILIMQIKEFFAKVEGSSLKTEEA